MVQVQEAWDHGFDLIEPDVGGVVEALKRLNPAFGVRLGRQGTERAWVVFEKHCPAHPKYEGDCPDCIVGMSREFVTSRRAVQNRAGTWEGLTHEVVRHLEKVGSSAYDFGREVEKRQQEAEQGQHEKVRRATEEHGEELAWAIRKDMG